MQNEIPSEFWSADEPKPTFETVKELIALLEKLPGNLPVNQGFSDGGQLTVFNAAYADIHLSIEEIDEFDDD